MAWNPWRALRAREHIVFALRDLPTGILGVYGRRGPRAAIAIERSLDRRDRRAVLAHELVHDERGGGIDAPGLSGMWVDVVTREELIVDREVARRLVPLDQLRDFARAREELGESTAAGDVEEEFDVPGWVARDALGLFLADVREGWR